MPSHTERRVLPYTPQQLYELVADIESYPSFLPWCLAARIRKREGNVLTADLVIGFKMIRERYTSRVTLTPGQQIDVAYVDGPMKRLTNCWRFLPHPAGCEIDFHVDFEFRSRVLQTVIGAVFHEAFRRMVGAFETRARALYGDRASAPAATAEG
ncbi:type II toxin-antitoxin system RatA family toxin [Inquilinus sp.]|uniref:type II toxin-antitoxin system RatA family toxin n=1 Tax=Inquilinus sp. TaxID=1932117 RepID=UPI0031CF87A8